MIPREVLANARGFAFLSVSKAGFLFSVRAGTGCVIVRTERDGWTCPSSLGTVGLGAGLMAGVEQTEIIIVLNSRSAVKAFTLSGSLTLGANATLAAGPVGRSIEGSGVLSQKGRAAMFSYSRSKGAFAGASLEGSVIVERKDANASAYGRPVTAKQLLTGQVDVPQFAQSLLSELARLTGDERGWTEADSDDDDEREGRVEPVPYAFGPGSGFATGGQGGSSVPRSRKNSLAGSGGYGSGASTPDKSAKKGSDYGGKLKGDSWLSRTRSNSAGSIPAAPTTTRSRSGSMLRNLSWSTEKKQKPLTSSELYNDGETGGPTMRKTQSQQYRPSETFEADRDSEDERYGPRTPPRSPQFATTSPFGDPSPSSYSHKATVLERHSNRNRAYSAPSRRPSLPTTDLWDSDEDLASEEDYSVIPESFRLAGIDLNKTTASGEESRKSTQGKAREVKPAERKPVMERVKSTPGHGIGRAIALFDYNGTETEDLSFKKGDVLTVLSQIDDEWWKGRNGLREGMFPQRFVEAHLMD